MLTAKILKRAGFHDVGMNGLELLRSIQAEDRSSGTPVLITSIDDAAERVSQAALAGATAFVSKPFDVSALKTNIQKVM